eukprot:COSAG04_NODE_4632_length_1983_cov_1.122611_1_plen_169_part_00
MSRVAAGPSEAGGAGRARRELLYGQRGAGSVPMNTLINLDEAWPELQGALERVVCLADAPATTDEKKFDDKEYMRYFTLVYNLCTQSPPLNYSQQLYQRYKKAISDYLNSAVLPAVREKTGQYMLKEVGKRWQHHKINVKWMKSFFSYLVRRLRRAALTQSLTASRRA